MARRIIPHYLLVFLWFLCCCFCRADDERQILLNLTATFQSSNQTLFSSWSSNGQISQFAGVTANLNGSVTEIDLSNRGLQGSLDIGSICRLSSLEKLAVGINSLHGTISGELKNCVKLKYLDLGNNFFTGEFPDISALTELQFLYLNRSGFSGSFPWSSLKNTTKLVVLSVGDNPFEKTQFPAEICRLSDLNWIYMSNCSIEGTIPAAIGNIKNLGSLELSDNYLSGEIPPEIARLTNLWRLELYSNSLIGKFPTGFGNLTKLEYLDASTNNLEGDLSELRFLKNLVSLQLLENNLSGEIPQEFGNFKKLTNLSLYTNKLTGTLPENLGSWAEFDFIDVSENFLSGTIPPDMCKLGTMTRLLMLQNNFSGEIPASYGNCRSLTRFRVNNNGLTGEVPPGLWGLPNLNIIDLASNMLVGPVTSNIGNAKSLTDLRLWDNQFSGELPPEISNAENLGTIGLSNNRFSGEIPATIGNLKRLSRLHLDNNLFSSSIPVTLGSCEKLSDLSIASNLLSGKIPSSLGNLPALNSLNLSNNRLSGQIPSTLSSLKLSLLDLSRNRLSGQIPQSLSINAYNGSFSGNSGLCIASLSGSFPRCPSRMSKNILTLIICFLTGSIILLTSFAIFLYLKRRAKYQSGSSGSLKGELWNVKSFHMLTFTETEILDSIKQENLIGKGGSGNVYRVGLPNGKELAVKHIWNTGPNGRKGVHQSSSPILGQRKGKSQEFEAEVRTLSSIRHVNVVKLYCSITSEDSSLLVYEYLPNGSLWDRLHTDLKLGLDWDTRYEIAIGAAKGLEYLHHGCERPVIHRDVKSSNILLDEFLKPRIADFGLARIVQSSEIRDATGIVAGTLGYIAPEYGYAWKVNEKSDVYSFGVVLLELMTGKKPIEPEYGESKDIVSWVSSKLRNRETALTLVDSRIPHPLKEEAMKVLKIAVICTERLPSLRPTMKTVVHMLEDVEPYRLSAVVIEKDSGGTSV